MNIQLFILLFIIGKSVDFLLQSNEQAITKTKIYEEPENALRSLLTHSFTYSIATVLLTAFIIDLYLYEWIIIAGTLLVTHFLIDTRIPIIYLFRVKGIDELTQPNYMRAILSMEMDQILHNMVILIISLII